MSDVVAEVFGAFPRADQRRWAEVYVRGLLADPGRKSVRRIAGEVGAGSADQALQQFLSQSPWDPWRVREALAAATAPTLRPAAWVVHEAAFPKNGRLSPGVARQYVRSEGRVRNCQLGLTVVLTDGVRSLPVDWQLLMPSSWDGDVARRARARVPESEISQPGWRHVVQAVDQVSSWTEVVRGPVVCEMPTPREAVVLGATLEELGHDYVIEVPGSVPVSPAGPLWSVPPRLPGGPGVGPVVTLAELVRVGVAGATVVRRPGRGIFPPSRFVVTEARPTPGRPTAARRWAVLADWPLGDDEPRAYWITNLAGEPAASLVETTCLRRLVGAAVDGMFERFGLGSYEGRTYLGWQHHTTLVSVAVAIAMRHDVECHPSSRRTPEDLDDR